MSLHQVQSAQRGDTDAFDELVRPAYDRLYAAAYRILRERGAAEDAVQDAIARCWRDLRGLRDPDRFEAWLYRSLINACRDQARRTQRRPSVVYGTSTETAAPNDDYASLADRDELERAFLALPADQRIALVLTHYVGYSAPEIAALLNVPTGTVYSRLHYGGRAMREALSPSPAVATATTESSR